MIEVIPNWHPAFVHFPIAFVTASVLLVAAGKMFQVKPWADNCIVFGRWMLWAAAITAFVAATFGWFAYNSVKHDDASHVAMTIHRNWALAALGALVFLGVWAIRSWRSAAEPSYGLLALLLISWFLVIITAWHGGDVVYRHGIGVQSMPSPEAHAHEQGGGKSHSDEHGHDLTTESKISITNDAGVPPKKVGHTHAPGAPPHKD